MSALDNVMSPEDARAFANNWQRFRGNNADNDSDAEKDLSPSDALNQASLNNPGRLGGVNNQNSQELALLAAVYAKAGTTGAPRTRGGSSHVDFNPLRVFTPPAEVYQAIQAAAHSVGVDFNFLLNVAARESSLRADAQAGTSSAKGLFQLLDGTADAVLRQNPQVAAMFQQQGGYNPYNAQQNATLGALYAAQCSEYLEQRIGHKPIAAELYLGHFLGPAGAASVLKAGPNAELHLSQKAINANPFLANMTHVSDLIAWAQNKMDNVHVNVPASALAAKGPTRSPAAGTGHPLTAHA